MRDSENKNKTTQQTRIIACAVFKPAIENIKILDKYPNLKITYLSSDLHMKPKELREQLTKELQDSKERNERTICLYGSCFPSIDQLCEQHGGTKLKGDYCYEMLLGGEQFKQLLDEMAGTYFLESDLIVNFQKCCAEPLELQDEEMRKACFQHYTRLLYVRQPSDPDLLNEVNDLAGELDLSIEVRDADYSHLEKLIIDALNQE